MPGFSRIALVACICGLVPLGACTRTSDGTVVMKKPPALTTLLPANPFWKKRETVHAPVAASQFPPAPRQTGAAGRTTQARRKPVVAKATLACLNQTGPGDRVRVVCD